MKKDWLSEGKPNNRGCNSQLTLTVSHQEPASYCSIFNQSFLYQIKMQADTHQSGTFSYYFLVSCTHSRSFYAQSDLTYRTLDHHLSNRILALLFKANFSWCSYSLLIFIFFFVTGSEKLLTIICNMSKHTAVKVCARKILLKITVVVLHCVSKR